MEAQVIKSLGKLKKLVPRSQKELKDVIDAATVSMTAALERKNKNQTDPAASASGPGGGGVGGSTEVPFEPFLLAVLTRQAKLVAIALDCIEKFLAFGFLKGNGSIPESIRKQLVQKYGKKGFGGGAGGSSSGGASGASGRDNIGGGAGGSGSGGDGTGDDGGSLNEDNWKLIDCIIEVICETNDHPDETVQIQVLRVLLTAVTTPTCEVHEHSLLKAVRACYHIHLVSKNATNQTVAKATLQQITSIVFQRMETFDQRVQEETEATLRESLQKSGATSESRPESEHEDTENGRRGGSSATGSFSSVAGGSDPAIVAAATASWYPEVVRSLQITLATKAKPPQGRSSLTSNNNVNASAIFAPSFPSVLHKDAFLLFRSLCRISMRSVAEDSPSGSANGALASGGSTNPFDDPFAFQSKILSLELVLSIINNAGPSFRRGERFIHAIRQYLCQSLLQNCTSNYTQIVGLSLQVFLVLINNFKRHLKAEIEIFVTSIFLRILQSENSSFEHKMLVLEVLNNICDDAQILGEIFLNYDCDWNTNDLFKQIVDVLAKTAKGKKDTAQQYANLSSSVRIKLQQNDAALVLKGLECMTATVASLKKAANFVESERKSRELQQQQAKEDGDDDERMAPATSPPASTTMSAVEAFDRKKRRQEELATGILKFNAKPSAGIQYLVQRGHLGEGTPRDVARFLHEHSAKLDKTEVGDYLGKEQQYQNGFCVKVLHEYVDMMDFTGMEIDTAIRHFLAGFRLPGESQKIDRMMEKFAERFYSACQPGLFPSADIAFILSFSIILLQTDLHNPNVAEEKKMDKAAFFRNNRGINNGEDLPEEYLGGIFDRIKQNPISLKEDVDLRARVGGRGGRSATTSIFGASSAVVDRQRRDAYIRERETMVKQSEALFKRRNPAISVSARQLNGNGAATSPRSSLSPGQSSQFHVVTEATEISHVRPMFETVWAPLLAVCSVIFESSDAPVAIQLCLNSFKHAIHLSARLNMPSERDAFVTVLSKFTALHTTGSRLMRAKNIEAIKALISISVKEGNYLGDAWRDILQCISQLARLQTHAQGLHADVDFFQGSGNNEKSSSGFFSTPSSSSSALSTSASKRGGFGSGSTASPSHSHRDSGTGSAALGVGGAGGMGGDEFYNPAIEDENAARVMAEIDLLASDRVFSSSVSLSDLAVQDFVVQLCVVSLSECSGVSNGHGVVQSSARHHPDSFTPPRVFSLQKLVEVADMNMPVRSRMVWASTWKVLSRHFTTIGCHDNLSIAMYAIDSLRQLSMKFLEKEELKDFNFQRLFLTPFEVIMANAVSTDIKELVLRCVENMILARVVNIRSGWKTIWGVLRVAAEMYDAGDDPHDTADRIVQLGFQIAKRILEEHFDRIVDVFVDAVECLLAFAVCGSEDVENGTDEHIGLTQLSVESISILETICIEKLATGQVIEKLFVEASASKRIGFKKKKADGSSESVSATSSPAANGAPRPLRYEKQESSRALEEEIDALSPPTSPSRRRSSFTSTSIPENGVNGGSVVYTDVAAHTRMWWPVLTALTTLAADRRMDVRLTALNALYDALERHGTKFSSGLWSLIFKGVIIPLLDELRHLEVFVEKSVRRPLKLAITKERCNPVQLQKATSTLCLERLLDTFGLYYDIVGFLPEVLFLLGKCMDTNDREEELAAASATALGNMLVAHGHKFPEDVWGLIADELRSVLTRAEPTWIFFSMNEPPSTAVLSPTNAATPPPTPFSPRTPQLIAMYPSVPGVLGFRFASTFPPKVVTEEEVNAQAVPSRTHLIVILAIQKMLGHVLVSRVPRQLALSEGHFLSLMHALRESYTFSRKVNDATDLRRHLARQGWVYGRLDARTAASDEDLPNLLMQEVQGKDEYLRVLFDLIRTSAHDEKKREDARRQMTVLVKQTFAEYLAWTAKGPDRQHTSLPVDSMQRVVRYTSLMVGALTQLSELSPQEMQRHLSWLFPLLNELIKTRNDEVRHALALVYAKCIGQLLPL
ncbi:hypothetical protein Poli38472_007375 [Pythium oligandrum]|uniref:SEC7 domain-containing protein n=1 Tax=Pythium oligandrum TaxID=41045 RepID=A0A8K1C9Z2_PYTOL|nr:hypothetical protein Poli38472_007375 [Pythium oligandrum]|eukprot:TMW59230.1 hypothetical protein Poli38472_007375 [Pythium oligandrum]